MSRLRARLDGARRAAVLIQEIRPQLEELQRGLRLDVDDLDLPEIPEVEPDLEGLPSAPGSSPSTARSAMPSPPA
jgi:hypothetical protein